MSSDQRSQTWTGSRYSITCINLQIIPWITLAQSCWKMFLTGQQKNNYIWLSLVPVVLLPMCALQPAPPWTPSLLPLGLFWLRWLVSCWEALMADAAVFIYRIYPKYIYNICVYMCISFYATYFCSIVEYIVIHCIYNYIKI